MASDANNTGCFAIGIGRPASQYLPEYADQPIPGPNSSSAFKEVFQPCFRAAPQAS